MRIVNEINFGILKATLFINNEKYSIKLEGGGMEQVFKFENTIIGNQGEAERLLDETFIAECKSQFLLMKNNIENTYRRNVANGTPDMDEDVII